jgi:hypothetical protein
MDLISYPRGSGVLIFPAHAYLNHTAEVTTSKMSHEVFTFSLFLFSGHLAWRFSGEEEKQYIPSSRLFSLYLLFFFAFRHFIIVGR